MSDLSNLLGDVYGDHSPDGPPVRREPAASERSPGWNAQAQQEQARPAEPRFTVAEPVKPLPPIDDDLAAALSAALNEAAAPAPAAPAEAPAPAPAPIAMAPMAPAPLPQPPAPVPVAVPVAVPQAPATVPAPVAMAPAAVAQEARFWTRGDDDIFPSKGSKKKKSRK